MKERFLDKIRRVFNNLMWKFKESSFVSHISFLWHWKNFFFLLKYPFYRVYHRWNGKFCGYSYSEYDSIPYGWGVAFGKQLSKDIKEAGKASRKRIGKHLSWKKMIRWQQIKEKYGGLRLYASSTKEIQEVLDKYEIMSEGYCICCGKPARYVTSGWIEYYCEDCLRNEIKAYDVHRENPISEEEIQERLKQCKLSKSDIPHGVTYTTSKNGKLIKHKIDYKKKYGIDFEELWGLKK